MFKKKQKQKHTKQNKKQLPSATVQAQGEPGLHKTLSQNKTDHLFSNNYAVTRHGFTYNQENFYD